MKVEPIKGQWVLFYDENKFILKECFICENPDDLFSEKISVKIPKNRIYRLTDWDSFKKMKDSLKYKLEDQFPVNFNI